ncbi:unnamed protein product, partial [Urochloa humidicola]
RPAAQAAGPSSAAPALQAVWRCSPWRAAVKDLSPARCERRPERNGGPRVEAEDGREELPEACLLELLVLVAIVSRHQLLQCQIERVLTAVQVSLS